MSYNVNKYHILQVGTKKQNYEYEMSCVKFESIQCIKGIGVIIALNLKSSQHCKDAAGKTNKMLGLYKKEIFSSIMKI